MALRAESISFAYHPGRPILRDVTCRIRSGAVTAILGPNGSGKTTLLRVLLGLRRPTAGRVVLAGEAVGAMSARRRAGRLAYVAQRPSLAFAFSVREVVGLGRVGVGAHPEAVDDAIQRVGIGPVADEPVGELSAGQQQLVALARALAQLHPAGDGKALLADEPLAPLDPAHARGCREILAELAARGVAVGVVIHDVTTAARIAEEAIVLARDGTVAAAGPVGEACTPGVLSGVYAVGFHRERLASGVDVLLPDLDADRI